MVDQIGARPSPSDGLAGQEGDAQHTHPVEHVREVARRAAEQVRRAEARVGAETPVEAAVDAPVQWAEASETATDPTACEVTRLLDEHVEETHEDARRDGLRLKRTDTRQDGILAVAPRTDSVPAVEIARSVQIPNAVPSPARAGRSSADSAAAENESDRTAVFLPAGDESRSGDTGVSRRPEGTVKTELRHESRNSPVMAQSLAPRVAQDARPAEPTRSADAQQSSMPAGAPAAVSAENTLQSQSERAHAATEQHIPANNDQDAPDALLAGQPGMHAGAGATEQLSSQHAPDALLAGQPGMRAGAGATEQPSSQPQGTPQQGTPPQGAHPGSAQAAPMLWSHAHAGVVVPQGAGNGDTVFQVPMQSLGPQYSATVNLQAVTGHVVLNASSERLGEILAQAARHSEWIQVDRDGRQNPQSRHQHEADPEDHAS